jgi:hypothetical protein
MNEHTRAIFFIILAPIGAVHGHEKVPVGGHVEVSAGGHLKVPALHG